MALFKSVKPIVMPEALPPPPDPGSEAEQAEKRRRGRAAEFSDTVYGSPLGLRGQADVIRKTLLGK